jgi:hypothetical protein
MINDSSSFNSRTWKRMYAKYKKLSWLIYGFFFSLHKLSIL